MHQLCLVCVIINIQLQQHVSFTCRHCIVLSRFCHFWHTSFWPTSTDIPSPHPSDRTDARHLTIIIITLFHPVNEDFPPYALTLPRHCCTILSKDPYPRQQQWQGLPEVEESQDTSRHSRDIMPVKPPRSEGDSQTAYIPMDFFFFFFLCPWRDANPYGRGM